MHDNFQERVEYDVETNFLNLVVEILSLKRVIIYIQFEVSSEE